MSSATRKNGTSPAVWQELLKWCAPLAAVTIVLGLIILAPTLRARAHAQSAADAGAVRVVLVNRPGWLGTKDAEGLQRMVAAETGTEPGNRDALQRTLARLENCGWYSTVTQVRRSSSGEVQVVGEFAVPFALVADGAGEHLIDQHGRLLPRTYAAGTAPRFPRLTGAREPRPVRPGMRWTGADLDAGLALARIIDQQRWRDQIEAIDVSDYAHEGQLRLVTTSGCTILWGCAPGEESPAEVSAPQKLRYLQFFDQTHGRIDAECHGSLDVRTDCVGVR